MNWAYISGFFDGEGCIQVGHDRKKNCDRFKVQFTQKNPAVLFEIALFLEKHGIKCTVIDYGNQWRLEIYRILAIKKFLEKTSPYLIVKLMKANETLAYIDSRPQSKSRQCIPVK